LAPSRKRIIVGASKRSGGGCIEPTNFILCYYGYMHKIYFATGNKGKFLSLQKYLDEHDVKLELEQATLDLVEPQADSATMVALAKARQAHEVLKAPVVVDDSSFHINALGGFPGPYIKYMILTIGISGILEFMARHDDRSAYFLSTLVYIDESGDEHVFEDEPFKGTIAEQIVDVDRESSWGELHKIFVPNGTTKTLIELSDVERKALITQGDSYAKFARYMQDYGRE
jgi:XTP/dITP diphosphohydrolase